MSTFSDFSGLSGMSGSARGQPAAPKSSRPAVGASNARREKLQVIKRREDLKDALVQKFRDKFGSAQDDDMVSLASVNIRREVDGFVGSSAPVTEANLARLERRLWRQAQGKPPADADSASVLSISAYTTGSGKPGSLSARCPRPTTPQSVMGSLSARGVGDAAYASKQPPASPGPHDIPAGASLDWSTLDRLAAHLHVQDSNSQRTRELELQHKLKQDLDKQVADVRMKQAKEKELDQKYLEAQTKDLQQWKTHEEEKASKAMEKAKEVKKYREVQLQQQIQKREQEKLHAKREAAELVVRIEQQNEEAKELTKQRRDIRRELAQQALVESTKCARQRSEDMQSRLTREEASIEEYSKMRKTREEKVEEETRQKVEINQKKMEIVVSDRTEIEAAKTEKEEAKSYKEMAAKNAAEAAREKANKDKLAEMRAQNQEFLFTQMQATAEKKRKEKEEKQRLHRVLEGDAKAYFEQERLRTGAQRQRNLEHRAELERQIETKMSNVRPKDAMSVSEQQMNRRLLERVSRLDSDVISSVVGAGR
mmetsp:Transcript_30465/g.55380  ORF Transcript_30465/g.55380 Transcript_30465/m.55380 type:complete len:540 (-) Transcript_30465:122-1741(-)